MEDTQAQDGEVQEQETVAEVNPLDAFKEKLAELKAEKTPEPTDAEPAEVDADPEPEAEPEQEQEPEKEPEQVKVEGPSPSMQLAARQIGIPEVIIAGAKDDKALAAIAQEILDSRERDKTTSDIAPIPEFKNPLPEDEFSKEDHVRRAVDATVEHAEGIAAYLHKQLNDVADVAYKVEKMLNSILAEKTANEEMTYDEFIDSLGNPVLGNRQSGNVSGAGQKQRQAIYWTLDELIKKNPRSSKLKLMEQAAMEHGYKSQETKRKEALAHDNKRRLGGGPSKAVPEPQLTGEALAKAKIQEILARTK